MKPLESSNTLVRQSTAVSWLTDAFMSPKELRDVSYTRVRNHIILLKFFEIERKNMFFLTCQQISSAPSLLAVFGGRVRVIWGTRLSRLWHQRTFIPPSAHTYRFMLHVCPFVIQMTSWRLKGLSALIGPCKDITAEGAPTLIWKIIFVCSKTTLSRELRVSGWLNSIHILFFSASSKTERTTKERTNTQAVKSNICKLIIFVIIVITSGTVYSLYS